MEKQADDPSKPRSLCTRKGLLPLQTALLSQGFPYVTLPFKVYFNDTNDGLSRVIFKSISMTEESDADKY